jgi:hypothetical protein
MGYGQPFWSIKVKDYWQKQTSNRDSSTDIAAGLRTGLQRNRGLIPSKGKTFLFSKLSGSTPSYAQPPVRQTSVIYPWAVKLSSHIHLVSRLRMHGYIPPFLHMPSSGGALLDTGTPLTFTNTLPIRLCFN